jgi:hypothetical protein
MTIEKIAPPLLTNLSAGADPEVFIIEKSSGTFVPSLDLIGGTKDNPRPTSRSGFFVQEDNVLGEYNIPPAGSSIEFRNSIKAGLDLFESCLPQGFGIKVATSHFFPMEMLHDPRAKEFGCTPDFNAWKGGLKNNKPRVPVDGLRTAGGHFHLGYTINDKAVKFHKMTMPRCEEINQTFVQWADLYAAVPSMVMDKDVDRRKLYGKAGAFRNKPYGVEYRTLSSFWLQSDELIAWLYEQMMRSVEKVNALKYVEPEDGDKIQAAVNDGRLEFVDELKEKYQLDIL